MLKPVILLVEEIVKVAGLGLWVEETEWLKDGDQVCHLLILYISKFVVLVSKREHVFDFHLFKTLSWISLNCLCNRHQSRRCELIIWKVNLDQTFVDFQSLGKWKAKIVEEAAMRYW